VARSVGAACEDIGFFAVVGHGVPLSLVGRARELAREFFALSEEEKLEVAKPRPDLVRGFLGLEKAAAAYSHGGASPPDLRETLAVGPTDVPDDPYFHGPAAGGHSAANLWPRRPAELRTVWTELFARMAALSLTMMRCFALALDLNEHAFDATIDRPISMMEGIHYPPPPHLPEPGQLRIGAHTDHGTLTFVSHEAVPGALEVSVVEGEWTPAPDLPDGFVVNVGDLMARWTNDRWRSTLHRVGNPPPGAGAHSDRLTMAFFHQPNYDAVVQCLPSCWDAENPPKYEPVTSGDHLRRKYSAGTTFRQER
jgi:isopenicillin N synthase-like dioxygenase